MAGSITWREYTADDGNKYSVRIDESNANATCGVSTQLMPVRTSNWPQLPRGLKMRYALATNIALPDQKRKFHVGTQLLLNTLQTNSSTPIVASAYADSSDTSPGVNANWTHTYYKGETRRNSPIPTAADTGLTDGTTAQ